MRHGRVNRLLPTRAQLDAATAKTAAVMADPRASRAQREHASRDQEQVGHILYLQRSRRRNLFPKL